MDKATRLLEQIRAGGKDDSADVAVADVNALVDMPLYGRKTALKAAARLYRIIKSKQKALDTELELIKDSLRTIGQHLLDENALSGKYYSKVVVGGVPVSRANKFKPVPCTRDALMDVVGENEYRIMFNEDAYIQFESADQMEEFLTLCKVAGIAPEGKATCKISGTPKLAEHIVRCYKSMDPSSLELLRGCAVDQRARVGGK